MGNKTFIAILGLLIAQAGAAVLMGIITGEFIGQAVIALIFAAAAVSFTARAWSGHPRAAIPALLAFTVGFLDVVYLSFRTASLWLVIILALDAAGFILALDTLDKPRGRKERTHRRKELLEKELPQRRKPKVVVYDVSSKKSVKRKTTKKRAAPRTTTTTTKTVRTTKKKAVRKTPKKRTPREQA